jgi:hypothetical protein
METNYAQQCLIDVIQYKSHKLQWHQKCEKSNKKKKWVELRNTKEISHNDMNDTKLRRFNGIHKNSTGKLKFGHWNVSKSRIKKRVKFLIKEEKLWKEKRVLIITHFESLSWQDYSVYKEEDLVSPNAWW